MARCPILAFFLRKGGWPQTSTSPSPYSLVPQIQPPQLDSRGRITSFFDFCTNTGEIHRFNPFLHLNPQIEPAYSPNQVMAL